VQLRDILLYVRSTCNGVIMINVVWLCAGRGIKVHICSRVSICMWKYRWQCCWVLLICSWEICVRFLVYYAGISGTRDMLVGYKCLHEGMHCILLVVVGPVLISVRASTFLQLSRVQLIIIKAVGTMFLHH